MYPLYAALAISKHNPQTFDFAHRFLAHMRERPHDVDGLDALMDEHEGLKTTINKAIAEAHAHFQPPRPAMPETPASTPSAVERFEDLTPSAKADMLRDDRGRFLTLLTDFEARTGQDLSDIYHHHAEQQSSTAPVAGGEPERYRGKTLAELRPLERARLMRDDPERYQRMQSQPSYSGKRYDQMRPAERAQLARDNPELFSQMRKEAGYE